MFSRFIIALVLAASVNVFADYKPLYGREADIAFETVNNTLWNQFEHQSRREKCFMPSKTGIAFLSEVNGKEMYREFFFTPRVGVEKWDNEVYKNDELNTYLIRQNWYMRSNDLIAFFDEAGNITKLNLVVNSTTLRTVFTMECEL